MKYVIGKDTDRTNAGSGARQHRNTIRPASERPATKHAVEQNRVDKFVSSLNKRQARDAAKADVSPAATAVDSRVAATSAVFDPQMLAKLGNLELISRTVVDGFLSGKHRSTHKGGCTDFAEFRPYARGDDLGYVPVMRIIAAAGAAPRWDDTQKAFYAMWESHGVFEHAWLEDARAFEAKLALVRQHGLRGYSVWLLGLEDPRAFEVVGPVRR